MEQHDLNTMPVKMFNGELSCEDTVRLIGSFIAKNYRVFNLQKYDEDFRSEIIITFLENGNKFLQTYNPDLGDFFSFLYCFVNSIANTKMRSLIQKKLKDSLTIAEGINTIEETEYNYSKITHHLQEIPRVPYSYKTPNVNELKKIFSKLRDDNTDKKILVLAIKSSFYLSDSQIKKISRLYNIKEDDLYAVIQYFKNSLLYKSEKKIKAEERRNFAYYHHKKYKFQLEKMSENGEISASKYTTNKILNKEKKHKRNWNKMNEKLENGFLYLRPTSKSVAEVLGICERQVTYYINCAKKEVLEKESKKDKVN